MGRTFKLEYKKMGQVRKLKKVSMNQGMNIHPSRSEVSTIRRVKNGRNYQ
jgi:hypothetical protein